jgi:Domain of unknown function DUF302
MATIGLITVASNFPAQETMDRLAAEVQSRGMTVFARVDHAAGAAEVGLDLRPTEVIVFGNARGGTPLMQAAQSIGLDLRSRRWFGKTRLARYGWPTMTRTGWRNGMASALKPHNRSPHWPRCSPQLPPRLPLRPDSRAGSRRRNPAFPSA